MYTLNPRTLEAERQLLEFQTSLIYRASSKTVRTTQKKLHLKKNKDTKQNKNLNMKGCRDGSVVKNDVAFPENSRSLPNNHTWKLTTAWTPALWNMKASSGLHEHLRTRGKHTETARKRQIHTNIHTYKSFIKTERERGKTSVKNSR